MEQPPPAASAATSSSSGSGPAPFLLKTYNMIDDSSTDDIVSWSSTNSSFVVWNPPEFSSRLLPTYFKHNNFSSFIRQLNTYGFHKIDPEKWEFANEDFVKGQKHLLKNIHRRKPIHSHSQLPADAERAALEEEIETLEKDKARLQADSLRFKHQHSAARVQLDDLEQRMRDMEQRQERLVSFLQRAVQNPKFVENIVKMAGTPDFFTPHGKRRLPGVDCCAEISESSYCENSVSTHNLNAADAGDLLNQELCDKLKLGLCPTFSDSDFDSHRREINGGGILRIECLSSVPETLEHSDTGASFGPRKSSLLMAGLDDVNSGLLSCHLDLTLASSSMQNDRTGQLNRIPSTIDLDAANAAEQRTSNTSKEADVDQPEGRNKGPFGSDTGIESSKEEVATLPAAGRVNDKFWEQFLTERPGSSDTEEASSSLRGDEEEQEENIWENVKDMKHLSL